MVCGKEYVAKSVWQIVCEKCVWQRFRGQECVMKSVWQRVSDKGCVTMSV